MDKELLLAKIDIATQDLSDAAAHLKKVISEIENVPRAEKTGISEVVKAAFTRLNGARLALKDLEYLVVEDDS